MEKLEITAEAVLAAASKCSTAKEVLQTLFPEVFKPKEEYFDLKYLAEDPEHTSTIFTNARAVKAGFANNHFMQIRGCGIFRDKGFYLDGRYDWAILKDDFDERVLVPKKRS